MTDSSIISKIWNLAGVLRDDGVGYGDYLEQITYLLFLKMSITIPSGVTRLKSPTPIGKKINQILK